MVRSFLNAFDAMLNRRDAETRRNGTVRTHPAATVPASRSVRVELPDIAGGDSDLSGTILTGEMFAPILQEQIERYNTVRRARLSVVAVPNTYFGGDVSVAGLLTGQDLVAMKGEIVGDFVIIPRVTIKSDEPIFLDGMTYDGLKSQFDVPVYDLDTDALLDFLK